jgi:hypothetical protein
MRKLLDESSVAQSLDGERLVGSLHVPTRRLFPDLSDCKDRNTHRERSLTGFGVFLPPHSLHDGADFAGIRVDDGHQFFNGEVAVSL